MVIEVSKDSAVFSDASGIYEFAPGNLGWHLARISDADGEDLVRGLGTSLWQISARSRGRVHRRASARIPAELVEGRGPKIRWDGFDLAGSDCAVELDIIGADPTGLSLGLSLSCDPPLPLWEVDFPVVGALTGHDPRLYAPYGYGKVFEGGTDKYEGKYPDHGCTMQFLSWGAGSSSLYLGCHDPRAAAKYFKYSPGGRPSIRVSVPVPGMGEPVSRYRVPHETILRVVKGDWFDVACVYRDWVSKQSWFPKRKVATRSIPERLKSVALWCRGNGHPDDVVPKVLEFNERFDVPIAFHWYQWHQIPFDDHYPEYFPPKEGFEEGVARLRDAGVLVMPYINARLWDSRTDSWREEGARSAAAKNSRMGIYKEVYGNGVPLTPMCPTKDLWRSKVKGIVHRLAREYGVQGIYLDQIAAANPAFCFDDGHDHPRGGGEWWVEGYRTLLGELQREVSRIDPGFFITTESNAEPWNDLLDALLMCNSTQGNQIPLYPAVYGDRVLTYGAYIYPKDIERTWPFRTKVSLMFLWGTQLGWLGFSILEKRFGREAEYLGELARIRVLAKDYLASGRMLRPPAPDGDVDMIKTRWELWNGSWDVEMPGAQASVWREPGGGVGVVACNMMDKKADLVVEMALADLGWSRDMAMRIVSKGHFGTARLSSDSIAVDVGLEPRSAKLLT